MFQLITSAFAEGKDAAKDGGTFGMLIPIIAMIAIFYFLLIRPNQKKEKEKKSMISNLQKGEKVLTSSGIYGVIVNIKDDENIVVLKIAEGTKVEFAKSSIQAKIS